MTDTLGALFTSSALKTCRARLGRGFKREWEKENGQDCKNTERVKTHWALLTVKPHKHTHNFSDRQIAHLSILEHPFEVLLHLLKFARLNSTVGQQHSSKLFSVILAIHWLIPRQPPRERERREIRERARERERDARKQEQAREKDQRERESREEGREERERRGEREEEKRERERGERERERERERRGGGEMMNNASEINIVLSWSISFIIHVQPNT